MTAVRALAIVSLAACGAAPPPPAAPPPAPAPYAVARLALPGGGPGGVGMDYLAYDARTNAVWVPTNTGAVVVVDAATNAIATIAGWPTREVEREGRRFQAGPSSVAIGAPGTVYIGSRGDSTVCAVDETTHAKGACATLAASPDALLYVDATRELWVTTPRASAIHVLDAATLADKATIALDGAPEGFAVDAARGRVYTNLEDRGTTLALDAATHATLATWQPGCGEDGPKGLRFDAAASLLVVACHDQVRALAVATGAVVGSLATTPDLDAIDYDAATHLIYAAGTQGALTIGKLDPRGAIALVARVPTGQGARNGVVAKSGALYLPHGKASELLVVSPPR